MANHYEIKPDENGLALRMAMKALRSANSQATANPGSIYIPNGDGTGTLIGSQASDGAGGLAPFVGDTTPPGRPSGISCSSAWGTLYVTWDGTLEGGVPADFAYVSVLVDGVEIERLAGAGTAVREDLENGSTVQVSAVAYDAARDGLGNPAPNASEPWGPVSVAISDERAEIDAEVEQIRQDAEEMGAKVDKVAGDAAEALEKAQETVEQVTADVAEAKEAAQEASDKADGYAQQIADATATVNDVKQDVSELTTKVEGAAKDAAGALTAATEAKQTATEVSTTAERAYEDAQSALSQSSQAVQTATGVKTTLETEYVSKADASSTYSTKAEVEATSSKLSASITEAAETAEAAQEKALEVEATASGLSTTITQVSQKADAAQSTADGAVKQVTTLKATVDGVSSAVTKAQSTADSAVSAASKAQQTVDGFKTEVSQKYQPKGDYASKGDLSGYQPKGDYATKSSVEQTATQIRQQVADTYATKTALDQERTDRQSAITQSATQVKSEVSSTYLKKTDASSTYATKASLSSYATKSSVDQTASQIKSEVAATYATQEDVDGISVGGTNLLLGTSYKNLSHVTVRGNYGTASIDNSDTVGSRTSLKLVTTQAGASGTKDVMHDLVPKLENKRVVVSFWVKGSVAASMMVRIGGGYTAGSTAMDKAVTTSWKRVVLEMGPLSGNGPSESYVIITFNKAGTFRVSGMKCEYGNKPTDWSPAPEDMLSAADASATYATKSSVTQTASEIKSEVATTYLSKTNASSTYATKTEMKQSDDSIKSTVSSVKTTADSAVSAASKAQQTVDGFKTEVSQKYQPKGDYASKGDLSGYQPKGDYATKSSVEQTATQIRQQVADTYATKTALDQERTDRQSAITQSATQVKSEVSSTYLKKTDASSTYATKASLSSYATKSSVDQTASQIKSEVAATYATQEDVDGISVGGTNLLLGTSYKNLSHVTVRGNYGTASIDNSDTVGSRTSLKLVTTQAGASGTKDVMHDLVPKLENKRVVVSFWVKGSVAASMMVRIGGGYTAGSTAMDKAVTTSWKRVVLEMGPLSGNGPSESYVIITFNKAGTFRVSGMKCEYGNKPTDWSPAPEDMLSAADASATYATKSSVTQTASEIKSEVATTYLSKTNASSTYATKTEMKQSDDSIKSTVSSVKTTADSALKKATTVEQTADGLEVKITSAVSTANTAKSTADSAKSTATTANNTANSAKTTATNAQNTANTAKSTADSAKSTATTANSNASTAKTNAQNALNRATYQYGTCSTAAATAAKAVTLSGFSLFTGATVQVKFTNANSAANPTLNVNSTGAKTIRAYNANLSASSAYNWVAGAVVTFVYDGTYWNIADGASLSKANSAQSKANSAATAASNAQSTANTANSTANAAKTAAANAAKTATNYLGFSSGGLVVGTNSGGTGQSGLQGNVRTYSGGMEVRNGTTVLARYGASTIELGLNSSSSQVKMCGNHLRLYAATNVACVSTDWDNIRVTTDGNASTYLFVSPSYATIVKGNSRIGLRGTGGSATNSNAEIVVDGESNGRTDTFFINAYKFGQRMDTQTLWTGNLGRNGTGTLQTDQRFDDWRIFAIRLGADNIFLTGLRRGNQIHASNGTDDGKNSYTYVCQITVTSETTFKYVSGSSHKITAIDSAMEDKVLNLSEIVGVC